MRRRSIVQIGLGGLCLAAMPSALAWGQAAPASMPPQIDDVLVKRGDPALKPLTVADIPGAQFLSAWPMAQASGTVRSGSRLNELMLVRVDTTTLVGASQSNGVEGVLAFSALCPHAGCNLATWVPDEGKLACDCHASEFDARASGKVIDGPASRPLPMLALKLAGDVLAVAKPFASPIRFDE